MQTPFQGFSVETFHFLFELGLNNYKSWFEENKTRYQLQVQLPMQQLVTSMSDYWLAIDPAIDVNPKKIISRIYRDVRFSKDKTPYRDHLWCSFKRPITNWQDLPTFYLEITPHGYSYGMGFYMASKETMDAFKKFIVERPDEFKAFNKHYHAQSVFKLEGERYKRTLHPELELDDDSRTFYQMKNFYFFCEKKLNESVYSDKLIDELKTDFDLLVPLYKALLQLKTS